MILEKKLHPARDVLEFQQKVLRRQEEAEAARPAGAVFSDRGIGDHFGYIAHHLAARGIEVPADFAAVLEGAWAEARARYRAVFVLEQAPRFSRESYRREDAAEARAIHAALEAAYRSRHPLVLAVPWEPLGERADRVLDLARRIIEGGEGGEAAVGATPGEPSPGAPRS